MSCLILFVCHDDDSISRVIHYNHIILLVGDKEIKQEYLNNPKIIVVRNLEHHIEQLINEFECGTHYKFRTTCTIIWKDCISVFEI